MKEEYLKKVYPENSTFAITESAFTLELLLIYF